jgi:hypothetical protein
MLGVILAGLIAAATPSPSPSPLPSTTPSSVPSASASPLPFVPPAGWTELPSQALRTQTKNLWTGHKNAKGASSMFTQIAMPMALPLDTKLGKRITVCGVPATLSTKTTGAKSFRMTVETQIAARGTYTYMTMYTRPAGEKADARIETLVRTFCPPADGQLADLTPPPGWTAKPSFQMAGVWMGPAPMQMMMLEKGPHMASLNDVAKAAPNPVSQHMKVGTAKMSVTAHPGTLCALPAMFVSLRSSGSSFPMSFDGVVTQSAASSYFLMYMHPNSGAPLAPAMNALKTLCANPPAATPSPSPAPSSTP